MKIYMEKRRLGLKTVMLKKLLRMMGSFDLMTGMMKYYERMMRSFDANYTLSGLHIEYRTYLCKN